MTLEKIPLEKYKWHQGEGSQWSYQGIALNPKEQAIAFKVNEMIAYINGVEAAFGIEIKGETAIDTTAGNTGCCKEDSEYKEDQLKGNEV